MRSPSSRSCLGVGLGRCDTSTAPPPESAAEIAKGGTGLMTRRWRQPYRCVSRRPPGILANDRRRPQAARRERHHRVECRLNRFIAAVARLVGLGESRRLRIAVVAPNILAGDGTSNAARDTIRAV